MKFVILSGPGLSAGGNNIFTRLAKFGRIFKKSVKTQNTFIQLFIGFLTLWAIL